MKKFIGGIICMLLLSISVQAQTEKQAVPNAFERIMNEMKDFKPDTTAVPDDKITKKIIELRDLRGGFNINEAILFKIEEDRQKKEISDADAEKLKAYFESGEGRRKIDNATIRIYRKYFSYKELKQLVKFYATDAGKKMSEVSPVIMLQTLAAAQLIKDGLTKK